MMSPGGGRQRSRGVARGGGLELGGEERSVDEDEGCSQGAVKALESLWRSLLKIVEVSSTLFIVGKMLSRNRLNCRKRWIASQAHDSCFCHSSNNQSRAGPEAICQILSSPAVIQWIQSLLMADCFML
jgi:hypothetical protein